MVNLSITLKCLYPKTAGGGILGSRCCLPWLVAKYRDWVLPISFLYSS